MDPIFLTVGDLEIRWYSALILFAVFIAYGIISVESRRFRYNNDKIFNLMFWSLICGIIGARLYYVAFNYEMYMDNPIDILKVWEGGLAIHGGIIGGLLSVAVICKREKWKLFAVTDMICVPLLLAQAIGRWGNFFNMEAHGAATTVETLQRFFIPEFVIKGVTINGITYVPTFYIESILCIIGFVVLMFLRRRKSTKIGTLTAIYLMYYGIIRFFIEMSRTDSLMIGNFKAAQIVSVVMVIASIIMFMLSSQTGRFENLYNEHHGD